MQYKTMKYSVSRLVEDHEKQKGEDDRLVFDCPIQRPEGQWSNSAQSLLIHSVLQDMIVPHIYIYQKNAKSFEPMTVFDGKQRMTILYNFVKNGFKLNVDTPPVTIRVADFDEDGELIKDEDGKIKSHVETIEIKNKYFNKLSKSFQKKLMNFEFDTVLIIDATTKELEEQMYRLNNGKVPQATFKSMMIGGIDVASAIKNNILCNNFFENRFIQKKEAIKKADDMKCVFNCLALLTGMSYNNISYAKDLTKIAQRFKQLWGSDEFSMSNIDECNNYFEILNENLPMDGEWNSKDILTTTHIPVMIMNVDTYRSMLEDEAITAEQYQQFLKYFVHEGFYSDEYQQYVTKNVNTRANIESRIDVMDDMLRKFVDEMNQAQENETDENKIAEYQPKLIEFNSILKGFCSHFDNEIKAIKCLSCHILNEAFDFSIQGLNSAICKFKKYQYEEQEKIVEDCISNYINNITINYPIMICMMKFARSKKIQHMQEWLTSLDFNAFDFNVDNVIDQKKLFKSLKQDLLKYGIDDEIENTSEDKQDENENNNLL